MKGWFPLLSAWVAIAALSCDPVRDRLVENLGDEAPGVRAGPLHRPGQPCLTCHDEFSVAGTIYVEPTDTAPAVGARVTVTSANGASFSATTNEAGNFYIRTSEFIPQYPMGAYVTWSAATVRMAALVGRDGSCAACHTDPAGQSSPGHVFVPLDGVTP